MKNFKALLFVLVLAPVSVFAAIVGEPNTSGSGYGGNSASVNLYVNAQAIVAGQNEVLDYRFVDSEQADTFGLLNVGIIDLTITDRRKNSEFDIFVIGQPDSGDDFLDLEGIDIKGDFTYSAVISAADASQRPFPGAWSMGAAMLGLLAVGRRSNGKS
jgi:hypothetical protein